MLGNGRSGGIPLAWGHAVRSFEEEEGPGGLDQE